MDAESVYERAFAFVAENFTIVWPTTQLEAELVIAADKAGRPVKRIVLAQAHRLLGPSIDLPEGV